MMTIGCVLAFTYKSVFILIFICSVIYICRKLSGPGFSKEVRNLVLKRHIMTTVLWLITNTYTFINVSFILTRDMKDIMMYKGNNSWWACTLKIMFASQGFAIPLMRLSEPYFYTILTKKVRNWFTEDKIK